MPRYQLTIHYADDVVALCGMWSAGAGVATCMNAFTVREHDAYPGESIIPYYHDKMKRDLCARTGIVPVLTHISIIGDQGWMNAHDRRVIAHYQRQAADATDHAHGPECPGLDRGSGAGLP